MSITKKHYERIARILGYAKDKQEIISLLTAYLKEDNIRFDANRFKDAIKSFEDKPIFIKEPYGLPFDLTAKDEFKRLINVK